VNVERMELLLDVLKHVPRERFNMEHWVEDPSSLNAAAEATCGTVACAAGWLAMDPRARAQGLTLRLDSIGSNIFTTPTFNHEDSFRALASFFEITSFQAENLFHPRRYDGITITPKVVALRVRTMMRKATRTS
jgi:hypothetical protein